MNKKRRQRPKLGRILFLVMLIGAVAYINQVIVPETPPLFIATPTATRAPESFLAEAEALLANGKMSQAIQIYEKAIQADPRNVPTYVTLARLQVFTGDYEGAITNAENALLVGPSNATAHAVRGWALSLSNDFLEGEASLKRSLELDPNNALAYAYYAELLILQQQSGQSLLGSLDKAVEYSRTAQNLAPNLLETHRARGLVLETTGNFKEALAEFQQAVAINDNIADLHLALGRNYRYVQDYAKAVEEFNRANALNPSDPIPDTYISRTYAAVGEYAKAIQFAQQAVKDDPNDPSLLGTLGTMFYKNRQYNDAIGPLKLAVRGGFNETGEEIPAMNLEYGRSAEYYFTYGLTLARLGECGEAILVAQQIQQSVPDDEISIYNAEEMINICQEYATSGLPTQEVTPTSDVSPTPGLDESPTPEG